MIIQVKNQRISKTNHFISGKKDFEGVRLNRLSLRLKEVSAQAIP